MTFTGLIFSILHPADRSICEAILEYTGATTDANTTAGVCIICADMLETEIRSISLCGLAIGIILAVYICV